MEIPPFEMNSARFWIKSIGMVRSASSLLDSFQQESAILEHIYEDSESYDVFDPYPIPRIWGLPESSRQWSVAMVLRHVCLVQADLIDLIEILSQETSPRGMFDWDGYCPEESVGTEVHSQFVQVNRLYCNQVQSLLDRAGPMQSEARFRHPWFGHLNARQWHAFALFHVWVHRRQAQKIVAMMGVA